MKSIIRKSIVCMLALAGSGMLHAQTNFRELTFDKALQTAKQEGKMVFIDCYTSWCGPCKMMAKNEFPKEEMGNYLNPKFVCIKMDMEKGEGPQLLTRYDVNCFPTYLYLNSDGDLLFRMSSSMSTERFIEESEKGLANTETGIVAMMKRYKNGERSEEFIKEYLDELNKNMMRGEIQKVITDCLTDKTVDDFVNNEDYFKMFCNNIDQLDNPIFQRLYAGKDKLIAKYGEKADEKFYMVLRNHPYHFATFEGKEMTSFDLNKLDEYVAKLKSEKVKEADQIGAFYRYIAASSNKNWAEAYKQVQIYSKTDIRNNWEYVMMLDGVKNEGYNVDSFVKKYVKKLEKEKKALDSSDERMIQNMNNTIGSFNRLLSTSSK